jgi:hypothetical protein
VALTTEHQVQTFKALVDQVAVHLAEKQQLILASQTVAAVVVVNALVHVAAQEARVAQALLLCLARFWIHSHKVFIPSPSIQAQANHRLAGQFPMSRP